MSTALKGRPARQRLLGLCLALASATALARPPEPVTVDAQFDPSAQAVKLVKASDDAALKTAVGVKRVAITQFAIDFITQDTVSAETSGFASAGRASVTGHYRLVGLGDADFQATADSAYAMLVQQLQAQGLDVATPSELAAAPTWQRLVAAGDALPRRSDSSITVGPAGMSIYGVQKARLAPSGSGVMGALSTFSGVTSAIGSASDYQTLQSELGGAVLLEVSMRMHFAQLSSGNKGFLGRMSDTAKVSAKVHPVVSRAEMGVLNAGRMDSMSVQPALMLAPEAFTEVRKAAATTGDIAGAVAVGLLRAAIGSKDSHSSEKFEVVAEPQRYREQVGAGLAQAHALLIARMVNAR